MKKLLIISSAALLLMGCAHFQTTQTDSSYEKGLPVRSVTTRASAFTFFDASSQLSKFKATQSDKTQSASVGSLAEGSSGSNAVAIVQGLAEIAKALPK